jgi:hypothetical protein
MSKSKKKFAGPGYVMKMGSKQKNTPTNFSAMAMKKMGIPDVESYERVKNDPLAQNQMNEMMDNFNDSAKASMTQPVYGGGDININTGENSSTTFSNYAALGSKLKGVFNPKGSQAEFSAKRREASRKKARFDRSPGSVFSDVAGYVKAVEDKNKYSKIKGTQTKAGKFLRSIFK